MHQVATALQMKAISVAVLSLPGWHRNNVGFWTILLHVNVCRDIKRIANKLRCDHTPAAVALNTPIWASTFIIQQANVKDQGDRYSLSSQFKGFNSSPGLGCTAESMYQWQMKGIGQRNPSQFNKGKRNRSEEVKQGNALRFMTIVFPTFRYLLVFS